MGGGMASLRLLLLQRPLRTLRYAPSKLQIHSVDRFVEFRVASCVVFRVTLYAVLRAVLCSMSCVVFSVAFCFALSSLSCVVFVLQSVCCVAFCVKCCVL